MTAADDRSDLRSLQALLGPEWTWTLDERARLWRVEHAGGAFVLVDAVQGPPDFWPTELPGIIAAALLGAVRDGAVGQLWVTVARAYPHGYSAQVVAR